MIFEYKFNVRGYELDSYGHANHAVYLNYFEQARWELFHQLGLIGYFKENGLLLVVVEVQVRYKHEITLFDELVIHTEVKREPPYLVFYHKMNFVGSDTKVCKSTVKTLFLDEKRMVRDIPGSFLEKLT